MARILILPSGNTFSHLHECNQLGIGLNERGHDVYFGISRSYSKWASKKGLQFYPIPELWEWGRTDHPNVSWFINHDYVFQCVTEEIALIDSLKPDLILADFKYTASISAEACGCPLITKNILSMLPATRATFGFLAGDNVEEQRRQSRYLGFFDCFACNALNKVAAKYGCRPRSSMADFLDGEIVIVPDMVEFHGLESIPGHYLLIGPLSLKYNLPPEENCGIWELKTHTRQNDQQPKNPLTSVHVHHLHEFSLSHVQRNSLPDREKGIFLSLGSCCRHPNALLHLAKALSHCPQKLWISTSGANENMIRDLRTASPGADVRPFFDIAQLAGSLELYVSQGGLGGIYEALKFGVPLLIVPQQPEQDHNGRLVEKHGFGLRLWASRAFSGKEDDYINSLLTTPKEVIIRTAMSILSIPEYKNQASCFKQFLARYNKSFKKALDLIDHALH